MPETVIADVLIVGAGIAGLWIAREAVSRGYRCALIDESTIGQYASTRNQGWMQSGALDSLYGMEQLARDCRDGSTMLRSFAAPTWHNLLHETPGFLFLEGQAQVTRVLRWREQHEIPAAMVDWRRQSTVEVSERLAFTVQVPESVMDTPAILARLATELTGQVTWISTDDVGALIPERDGGRWRLSASDVSVESSGIVLACSSLIPTILTNIGIQSPGQLTVEDIPVVVLHHQLTTDVMATPILRTGPHLVPTLDRGMPRSTLILTRLLPEVEPAPATGFKDQRLLSDATMQTMVEELLLWYPGLADRIRAHQPVPMHGYLCQRLANSRSTDPIIWANQTLNAENYPPLVITYPGRFTAAPVRAAKVLDTLLEAGEIPCSGPAPSARSVQPPTVSPQPHFAPPTHWLTVSDWGTPRISKRG